MSGRIPISKGWIGLEVLWLCQKAGWKKFVWTTFLSRASHLCPPPTFTLLPPSLHFIHSKKPIMDDVFDGAVGIDLGTTYS